jgi:hypothetical protein
MAQKIDIGDYVNLNLDQNDMATALNNLNNPNGSQVIDNLMEQYDGVNMQQPQMMQPQMMQQQQMQQQQMQPQMVQMQPQMIQMQQPQMMTNLFNKQTEEKNKILKDLDLSEKKPEVETTIANTESTKKSLMLHMKETILVVLLYIMLGNDYINTYVTKYVPYFNESPLVLFVIKVILIGLLYHIIRYFMN